MKRAKILEAARSFLGVKFSHGGRGPEGVDCAGLVLAVCEKIGYQVSNPVVGSGYSREPDGRLEQIVASNGNPVPIESRKAGDVAVFWLDRETRTPQHVGIITETGGLIHAYTHVQRVVETTKMGRFFESRLLSVYSFRNVED